MNQTFEVEGKTIGPGQPCFVIAEAGVNHNGSAERALEMVDAAAAAGADAVKFQTYKTNLLVTPQAPKAAYQKRTTGGDESQFDMLRRLELAREAHPRLIDRCRQHGMVFMSSTADTDSSDFLASLGVAIYKIPSGEIPNLDFLRHVAGYGRPMIVSTGMCSLGEVETALEAIDAAGTGELVLLHCVSNYPADPADVNLRAMQTLRAAFGRPVGFSDHTIGIDVGVAAVALGACVIEKHFTLDRSLPGPDHQASLDPGELAALVRGIRTVEMSLGDGRKRAVPSERDTANVARKSLVAACDIPPGTVLTDELIDAKRPGTGLPPSMRPHLLNRRVRDRIPAGTLLKWELLA